MSNLSSGYMSADPITGHTYFANPIMTRIGATDTYLAEWTGDAADTFRTDFIGTFSAQVMNQFIACAVLHSALKAQQALWVSARANIDTVAHDTLTALDNMDHCGQNKWTMTWTIVASVAAVAAVPLSGGASVLGAGAALSATAAVTAVGATGQVLAAHQVTPKKETEYHGETAEVVIEQMRRGVNEAIGEIQQGELTIAAALRNVNDAMRQNRVFFVAPRPGLLDATPGIVFDDRYLGHER